MLCYLRWFIRANRRWVAASRNWTLLLVRADPRANRLIGLAPWSRPARDRERGGRSYAG